MSAACSEALSQGATSKSPGKNGPKRKTIFKRLEKGVFQRLGDKGKSISTYSNDSRRQSYHSSRTDTESCYESSRSRETEFASKNITTKEHPHEGQKRCRKAKVAQEDIGSQSQRGESRVLRTTCPNHGYAMPTWCHMFNFTLTGNVRVWFDDLPKESIDSYDDLKEAFLENCLQQEKCIKDSVKIHNIKQRDGESTEEFVRRFRLEVRSQMIPVATPLVGFSGEIIWQLGKISLLVKIDDEEPSTSAWMNFMIVRSPTPYNGIIGRPGQDHSTRMRVSGPGAHHLVIEQELCGLLRRNLDIFAWKPADMTGVSRHIVEHMLNIREGCLTVRQKKRGQAPERNKAIYEEVEKLVDADIMKEVHYHSWLSTH
nr:reverse transcriptase domain-containing protein [Tanacetum cinerariifolium]